MITVNRGYMYDPDDNEVLITEIYYEAATDTKLGSKMDSLSYSAIPNEIKEKNRSSCFIILYGKHWDASATSCRISKWN